MKHTASVEFFRYWEACRHGARAPTRQAFDPGPIRHLLASSFFLDCDERRGHPVRMAGTRLCSLFGHDLKGRAFASLWAGPARSALDTMLDEVAGEYEPAVAGVTAVTTGGAPMSFELTLLPLVTLPRRSASIAGLLVHTPEDAVLETSHLPLAPGSLALASCRYLNAAPAGRLNRLARMLRWSPGVTFYQADAADGSKPSGLTPR